MSWTFSGQRRDCMNIRKYEAFVRAVELGSLSKAAEELGIDHSTLLKKLKKYGL